MGKWATILRIGGKILNNGATRSLGNAVIHPQRTLVGAGRAVKTAAVGAGVGYVGWQALVNDKPIVRTVADVTIGEDNVDNIVETTGKAVDGVVEVARDVKESVSGIGGTVQQADSTLGGISDFMRNLSSGQGGSMFSNLFSNLFSGNVSGLSIAGLLAAGLMIFGRFGWLGKIGGALLAMMLIGNNSKVAQTETVAQQQPEEQGRAGGMRR